MHTAQTEADTDVARVKTGTGSALRRSQDQCQEQSSRTRTPEPASSTIGSQCFQHREIHRRLLSQIRNSSQDRGVYQQEAVHQFCHPQYCDHSLQVTYSHSRWFLCLL